MNSFLKALVQELYDVVQAGGDLVSKQYSALVSAGVKCGMDLPALVSSVGSAQGDLQALLSNPAADADLLAFVVGLVGNASQAAAVVSASADLALSALSLEPKVVALVNAIKNPPAAPAPAA